MKKKMEERKKFGRNNYNLILVLILELDKYCAVTNIHT